MLVQLQVEESQSKFFIDLMKNLNNIVNNITYLDEGESMKYQEENGFSKNILAKESENIWNVNYENEQFLAAAYNDAIEEDTREDEIWSKYL